MLIFLFLRLKIGNRCALLHIAGGVDRAGLVQQRFGERGLARQRVPDHGNIADIFGLIMGHLQTPAILVSNLKVLGIAPKDASWIPHSGSDPRVKPRRGITVPDAATGHGQ